MHWTEAAVSTELSDVKNTLTNSFEEITGNEVVFFTRGKYIYTNESIGSVVNLTPIDGQSRNNCAIINASEGDSFIVNGTGGNAGRLWAFVDSSSKLISKSNDAETGNDLVLIAPANANKLVLNVLDTPGFCCKGEPLVDRVEILETELNDYNLKNTLVFSSNYALEPCFIPAGSTVTVEAISGTFSGGACNFFDESKIEVGSISLTSGKKLRTKLINTDVYYIYVGGEQTPSDIRVYPTFEFKRTRDVIDVIGSFFATIGNSGKLDYDIDNYKISFGNNPLIIYVNGSAIVLDNSMIKTQLGNAADDSSGTLIITIGPDHVLAYDVVGVTLKIVQNNKFDYKKHIPLFSTRYGNGNGGLLITASNSISARENGEFVSDYSKALKTCYAYITNAGTVKYNTGTGILNIGPNSIGLIVNGVQTGLNHSTIISQLGAAKAVEDQQGNLLITIGQSNALVYSIPEQTLKIVQLTNVDKRLHAVLFTTYYLAGNIGLLADNDNSLNMRERNEFTYKNVINSAPDYFKDNFHDNLSRYADSVANASLNSERFLFFTDPHSVTLDDYENQMSAMMATIAKYLNSTPADYVICGGDWLGNNDTIALASEKMAYIRGLGKSILGGVNFYNIVGNHDTNYQGVEQLTANQIRNLWYSGDKCYYKVKRKNCTYFVLDTGVDNDDTLTNYRYEQLKWLCAELKNEIESNFAIAMHIIREGVPQYTAPMAEIVGDIISAYNNRTSISVDEENYDFENCTGKIYFVIGGHIHADYDMTLGGVPCVLTVNTGTGGGKTASFDLVVADFDNRKLEMTRVGSGSDRTFSI